ncbi:NrtR DNA-binding winged helix domain-containing protein, partial [Limosilactobacillus fermentum]
WSVRVRIYPDRACNWRRGPIQPYHFAQAALGPNTPRAPALATAATNRASVAQFIGAWTSGYSPVRKVRGQQFTLKEARNVYATFLKTTPAAIDNSNFRKTHAHLFEECGTATPKQSGRPPKIYRLRG